ncbi:MAG: hypothetical protein F4Y80_09235 [Caldilineaceae bacterium SB0665_bin_21]|nr:hypothetical protein [Caldilineaceae bacterium SB0665_bin_21]
MPDELLEHEVRCDGTGDPAALLNDALLDEIAGGVRLALRGGPQPLQDVLMLTVHMTAMSVSQSRFDDFVVLTEHPAEGAACHVTLTFLLDKIGTATTAEAHKRLRAG